MKRLICKNFAHFFVKKSPMYRVNTPSHKLLISNIDVKFCRKSQILRTKNTWLFEQNFLNTHSENTKKLKY